MYKGVEQLGITDDPFCGCTIIDKDHEASISMSGLEDYFRLLYIEVINIYIYTYVLIERKFD